YCRPRRLSVAKSESQRAALHVHGPSIHEVTYVELSGARGCQHAHQTSVVALGEWTKESPPRPTSYFRPIVQFQNPSCQIREGDVRIQGRSRQRTPGRQADSAGVEQCPAQLLKRATTKIQQTAACHCDLRVNNSIQPVQLAGQCECARHPRSVDYLKVLPHEGAV